MVALVIVGVPLAAAVVAGFVLQFFSAAWLVRISNGAMCAQVGLVLVSWLLLATMPGKRNWRESDSTCPDLDSFLGDVLALVAYGSVAVGAIALASAVLTVRRRAAQPGRILAGLIASALSFAIFVPLLFSALCGLS